MGEMIRKNDAAKDILEVVDDTLGAATTRKGIWQKMAEEHLGPVKMLLDDVQDQVETAEKAATNAVLAYELEQEKACRLVGKVHDELWNALDRPAYDPHFDLLFPGGCGYYNRGDAEGQPRRMRHLVALLRRAVHPRIEAEMANAAADTVASAADALEAAFKLARARRGDLAHLTHLRTTLARSAQMALANLKRAYKSKGLRETQIHEVIPARARKDRKKKAPADKAAAEQKVAEKPFEPPKEPQPSA